MRAVQITAFTLLLFISPLLLLAQETFTIKGRLADSETGEPIVGANIFIEETLTGTTSDEKGRYKLSVEGGRYTLVIKYLGYAEIKSEIELDKDLQIDFKPEKSTVSTGEVTITGESDKNLDQQIGTVELSGKDIDKMPEVLGETDVVKTIQLLPGVSSATDGNPGIYVRGGGPDQNLVLLDGASIYNVSHLFGFLSIFNTGSIDNIKLIKGSMPANYGGRLSSVLDITTIDGNDTALSMEGGIGIIATKATVQGPLKKEKSSFFFSGRRTYVDVLAQPVLNAMDLVQKFGYFFYDLNGKINFKLTDKDQLYFSGYFGRDVFTAKNRETGFGIRTSWGNSAAIVGYSHIFSEKLLLRSSVNFTSYLSQIKITQDDYEVKLSSGINDIASNIGLHYFPNSSHHIQLGVNYTYHTFLPTNIAGQAEQLESINLDNQVHLFSHDVGIYALDTWEVNPRLQFEYGLRFSYFQHVGPFDRYLKGKTDIIEDTLSYGRGDNIAQYTNAEPRLSLRIKTRKASAWKFSFTQNYQYVHLVSYATVSVPSDVWIPSTDIVKPQFATQYSVGNFKTFKEAGYELSLEGFYKFTKNQIEYKDGFTPEDEVLDNVDNNLTFGDGKAFGMEFFLKKVQGKATGWLGYTISTSKRQFDAINDGKEFFAKYDRLHDLSIVMAYELNDIWTFSTVFVYASGNATTMPIARYTIEGKIINQYGDRNSFRMPAYHRLDISATYTPEHSKPRKYESTWKFAIYNVYNRFNPYFIYFDNSRFYKGGVFETRARLISLFPFLPSVSWTFNF